MFHTKHRMVNDLRTNLTMTNNKEIEAEDVGDMEKSDRAVEHVAILHNNTVEDVAYSRTSHQKHRMDEEKDSGPLARM